MTAGYIRPMCVCVCVIALQNSEGCEVRKQSDSQGGKDVAR